MRHGLPPTGPLRCTVGGMRYQIHTQIDTDFQMFLTFFFFLSKLFVDSDLISGFHSGEGEGVIHHFICISICVQTNCICKISGKEHVGVQGITMPDPTATWYQHNLANKLNKKKLNNYFAAIFFLYVSSFQSQIFFDGYKRIQCPLHHQHCIFEGAVAMCHLSGKWLVDC